MATVIRNPDNTLTATLTAKEKKAAQRWADDHVRSVEAQVESELTSLFLGWVKHYREVDGLTKIEQYNALTQAKQAEVDAILATAVVTP